MRKSYYEALEPKYIPSRARILAKKVFSFLPCCVSALVGNRMAHVESRTGDPLKKWEPKILSAFPLTSKELS
jgi:hypothetical protein